jgi:DNA-binding XRE family transcriptional regulator
MLDFGAKDMARKAQIIDVIADAFGDRYDVRNRKVSDAGVTIVTGWPHGTPRGRNGCAGGPRIILTPELCQWLELVNEEHVARRTTLATMAKDLGISKQPLLRLRSLLGLSWLESRHCWWAERAGDLATLAGPEFAARHGVSAAAATIMRQKVLGITRQRPDGWWREPWAVKLLLSDLPTAVVADNLGLAAVTVRKLAVAIQRDRGMTADEIKAAGHVRNRAMHEDWRPSSKHLKSLILGASKPITKEHRRALRLSNMRKHRAVYYARVDALATSSAPAIYRMIDLALEGRTSSEIAEAIDVAMSSIGRWADRIGLGKLLFDRRKPLKPRNSRPMTAKQLRGLREAYGLTRPELAARCGISVPALTAYELNTLKMPLWRADRLWTILLEMGQDQED